MAQTMRTTGVVKIIIVEDYKLTRVGLRYTLNEFDHINVIGEAGSGEEALELVKKQVPDVILMDLGLPGINGLETTMKIKEIHPDVKVIVLTSHEREEEVLAALGAGVSGYCLKDIEPKTLSEVIRNVSLGACYIDPNVAKLALKLFPKPENADLITSSETNQTKGQLTEREIEVLKLLVMGKSNTEIAQDLIVSVHTAKAHVCSILQKLCVDDRVQAAVKAIKEKII
jgi:DNA-binding NarL/FixJ family response regulator